MTRKPATVEDRSVELDGRKVKTCPTNVVSGLRSGQIHVHAAGCADLKRGEYRNADVWGNGADDYVEATCLRDVVESVYGPDAGSFFEEAGFAADDPNAWRDFVGEFRVFPCVSLPDEPVFVTEKPALRLWAVTYSVSDEEGRYPHEFTARVRAGSIVRIPWAVAEREGVSVDRIDVYGVTLEVGK